MWDEGMFAEVLCQCGLFGKTELFEVVSPHFPEVPVATADRCRMEGPFLIAYFAFEEARRVRMAEEAREMGNTEYLASLLPVVHASNGAANEVKRVRANIAPNRGNYYGVSHTNQGGTAGWRAILCSVSLGRFDTEEDAARAVDMCVLEQKSANSSCSQDVGTPYTCNLMDSVDLYKGGKGPKMVEAARDARKVRLRAIQVERGGA
jgi:hypothetical protein